MPKLIDLTGQTFGNLKVLYRTENSRAGHTRWACECICGKRPTVLSTHLIQGNTKSCGCGHPKGIAHKQWSGVGELSGEFWNSRIVRSASGRKGRRQSVDLQITKEYAWQLFLQQNRRCALTEIELYFPDKWKGDTNASLDRIDSSKGYVEGNVQWVHKDINMMKRTYDNDYFIKMCCLVSEKYKL